MFRLLVGSPGVGQASFPHPRLEMAKVSGQSASLGPSRPAPPFGLGVTCRVLGFWGSSGEEIREELRWDGTQYLCSLEVPPGEDAMFQIDVEGAASAGVFLGRRGEPVLTPSPDVG